MICQCEHKIHFKDNTTIHAYGAECSKLYSVTPGIEVCPQCLAGCMWQFATLETKKQFTQDVAERFK